MKKNENEKTEKKIRRTENDGRRTKRNREGEDEDDFRIWRERQIECRIRERN